MDEFAMHSGPFFIGRQTFSHSESSRHSDDPSNDSDANHVSFLEGQIHDHAYFRDYMQKDQHHQF